MDLSLSEVPLLEVISLVFLVSWMDLGQEDHGVHELSLFETLIDQEIVFFVDSSVTSLAGSDENFVASPQSGRVESLEINFTGPVHVTVMSTNCVDLFFVTFNTVWGTNVISVDPSLVLNSEAAAQDT
jgi:hypothetical protein